jgi:transcriptional regulator with XRE-family HTH domain
MNVSTVIRTRLKELNLDQKGLAAAAGVTESYISQLLNGKKFPPAPGRTDIYQKMGEFLHLSNNQLANLALAERLEHIKSGYEGPPEPLLNDIRELLLRKCMPRRQREIRNIFESQPLGVLERLVTQKLLDVISGVARAELENQNWLHDIAQLTNQSNEQMRKLLLEFLDSDIFSVSNECCTSLLDPLIVAWDIDPENFNMEIVLNRRLVQGHPRKFAFVQTEPEDSGDQQNDEPGLVEFLRDPDLSRDISAAEVNFLRRLKFGDRRPRPIYYYRELQNLRDPLHFRLAG